MGFGQGPTPNQLDLLSQQGDRNQQSLYDQQMARDRVDAMFGSFQSPPSRSNLTYPIRSNQPIPQIPYPSQQGGPARRDLMGQNQLPPQSPPPTFGDSSSLIDELFSSSPQQQQQQQYGQQQPQKQGMLSGLFNGGKSYRRKARKAAKKSRKARKSAKKSRRSSRR